MDDLSPLRDKLAAVIADARAFSAPAGSAEMRRVQGSLDYLGYAYSYLQDTDANPAWTSD